MEDPAPGSGVSALHETSGQLETIDVSLSGQTPRYALRADDVAAIAFLPPPRTAEDRLGHAWAALCEASAGSAPTSFEGPDDLCQALAKRQHVGALALIAPTLHLDEAGEPSGVRFSLLDPRLGAGFIGGEHNVGSPVDRQRHEIARAEGAVRIVCWQRFGLGSPLDPHGRYGAGAPRPLGWIRISCDIDREGMMRTHLACSYLPTVWFYRDGARVHRFDARERTVDEMKAVLRPTGEVPTGTTHRRLEAAGYLQPLLGGAS